MKIRLPRIKLRVLIPVAIAMYGIVAVMLTLTIRDTGWNNMTVNAYASSIVAILFTGFMAGAISWMWSYEDNNEDDIT